MRNELPLGLAHVFANTQLLPDDAEYVLVSFAPEQVVGALSFFSDMGAPFSAAVVDKDEVTILLRWDSWFGVRDSIDAFDEARGYRLVTFDTPADLGMVGFVATLSSLLAEAGIGLYYISAYTRDHILVQEGDLDEALKVISAFIDHCRMAYS